MSDSIADLNAYADILRTAGWIVTAPPAKHTGPPWEVGNRVRYVKSTEWGAKIGWEGTITKIRELDQGKPRNDYQVFWVRPDKHPDCIFWTTPDEVESLDQEATDNG